MAAEQKPLEVKPAFLGPGSVSTLGLSMGLV
jgi:hypothetical protein